MSRPGRLIVRSLALLLILSTLVPQALAQLLPPRPILYFGVWSEGGERTGGLRIVDVDGTAYARFEGTLGAVWNPQGERLAFVQGTSGRPGAEVFLMGWESGRVLYRAAVGEVLVLGRVAWSPDGRQLALLGSSNHGGTIGDINFELIVIDSDTGIERSRVPLPRELFAHWPFPVMGFDTFCWSPDGQRVLISFGQLVVVDLATEGVDILLDTPAVAAWSPSGSAVYYLIRDPDENGYAAYWGLARHDLDRSQPDLMLDQDELVELSLMGGIRGGVLSFSPSGKSLALATGSTESELVGQLRIYAVDPEGDLDLGEPDAVLVTDLIGALEWSPDERSLAVVTHALDSNGEVVAVQVVDLEAGTTRTLDRFTLESFEEIDLFGWYRVLSWSR